MSNEIWHSYAKGSTLYALIWNSDAEVYDADAADGSFEAYDDASLGTYDIPMTNQDGDGTDSSYYTADFPTAIDTDGAYKIQVFRQEGDLPDVDDPALAQGEIYWDSSLATEITLDDIEENQGGTNVNYDERAGGEAGADRGMVPRISSLARS